MSNVHETSAYDVSMRSHFQIPTVNSAVYHVLIQHLGLVCLAKSVYLCCEFKLGRTNSTNSYSTRSTRTCFAQGVDCVGSVHMIYLWKLRTLATQLVFDDTHRKLARKYLSQVF